MRSLAKRLGLKQIDVAFPQFGYGVICVIGAWENGNEFANRVHDAIHESPEGDLGCVFDSDGCWPILWLPAPPKSPRELGVLAHEALHAVHCMMRRLGVPLNRDTEEIWARHIDYLVTEILTNCMSGNARQKKKAH